MVLVLLAGLAVPANAATRPQASWDAAADRALERLRTELDAGPVVGSVGGEWAVVALARAGKLESDDPWLNSWFADLDRLLAQVDALTAAGNNIQRPRSAGTFPSELRRWTDFQRVTIALSSLGLDASNHGGRDLTAVYRSFVPPASRHGLNAAINADAFALIALDTRAYDGDRDRFLVRILETQRANGSWGLSTNPDASDISITAMTVQALAPYYAAGDRRVIRAVHRALGWLDTQTFADTESTAQMIVALTALGSDYAEEAARYVSRLMTRFDARTGGFRRTGSADPVDLMATEQAAYALVAYRRFINGMNTLYDMSDAGDAEVYSHST